MKVLISVLMLFGMSVASELITADKVEEYFRKFARNDLNRHEEETLQKIFDILHRPEHLDSKSLQTSTPYRITIDCLVCRSAFAALFEGVALNQTDQEITDTIVTLCVALGIESYSVCLGAVSLNMPIITHIIRNTPEAAPATFCGLVLQEVMNANACLYNDPRFEWQVELPERNVNTPSIQNSSLPFTVAFITDAHLDPLYEAYGVADCSEPTCCRKGQSPASRHIYKSYVDESLLSDSIVRDNNNNVMLDLSLATQIKEARKSSRTKIVRSGNSAPAGYWGDYRNCDTPIWAFDDAIRRISETHRNVDAIYYIGDTIDHFVWETTYELINDMNRYLTDRIRSYFGDNVPVLSAIGNHEAQPTNQFAPASVTGQYINTTWLYEALVNKWGFYLPEEAQATLRERGDYSVLLRPGLRVISLNNNVAYKYNWWLVYDPLDAKKHLDWLVDELYKAELAGEKVHILAHIPPGVHDLTHTWTREYNRIVNRFSDTIAAEFNGHTHSDEFKLFYDEQGNPINVAWGGGSITAYTNYNLNYKIATFDPVTYEPENIVNYVYNLTEANLTPNRRPHWFQLYDIKNTYGLTSLSPGSINDLVYSMVTNRKELLTIYNAFYSKVNDNRWPYCNNDCFLDNLCKIVVTVLWDRERCNELRNLFYTV